MSVSDLLVKAGDGELELVYYNWRYYNPLLIWLRRDCYISDNNENKYCMCHNNPIGSYDLLGMKTREQREADRRNAHARQATGRMLNREKARQNDINRLANQNTNVHTNNNLVPGFKRVIKSQLITKNGLPGLILHPFYPRFAAKKTRLDSCGSGQK